MGRPVHNTASVAANEEMHMQAPPPPMQIIERIVYLSGEVNEQMIIQVIAGMIALANADKNEPITLVISTYGGSVDEMFSLYDIIKYIPCPVHTVGLGKVMSAGVLLLASGKKGNRLIGQNARLMVHPISGAAMGNVFEVVNETKEHVRQQNLMESLLLRETKLTDAQLKKLMESGHDNYIFAEDAVRLGIVDKIIGDDKK